MKVKGIQSYLRPYLVMASFDPISFYSSLLILPAVVASMLLFKYNSRVLPYGLELTISSVLNTLSSDCLIFNLTLFEFW